MPQVSSINCLASSALSPGRDHPADDVAAEDVEDHVEIEVGPLGRTEEFGDVPAPDLIGAGGQQFRLLVGRVAQLIAPLAHFPVLVQKTVHRARRAEVEALVQQRGVDLVRRLIHEPFRVQMHQGGLALRVGESPRRLGPWGDGVGFRAWRSRPIEGGPRKIQSTAGRRAADRGRQLSGCRHELPSSRPAAGSAIPSRAETFF